MRHGRSVATGKPCTPRSVRVVLGNRAAVAMADCVCGLAEFEGVDVESALEALRSEFRLLSLDVPEQHREVAA